MFSKKQCAGKVGGSVWQPVPECSGQTRAKRYQRQGLLLCEERLYKFQQVNKHKKFTNMTWKHRRKSIAGLESSKNNKDHTDMKKKRDV